MFFEEWWEGFAKNCRYGWLSFCWSEFCFGLTFELNFSKLYRNHSGESFDHIISREVLIGFFDNSCFASIWIDRSSKGGSESRKMSSSFRIINIVGESNNTRLYIIDILQCNFYWFYPFYFLLNIKNSVMNWFLLRIIKYDQRLQPSFEIKCLWWCIEFRTIAKEVIFFSQSINKVILSFSRINHRNTKPFHKIRLLTYMINNPIVIKGHSFFKN